MERHRNTEIRSPDIPLREASEDSIVLTPERIALFLEDLHERNCTAETLKTYSRILHIFYDYLPEDKRIRRETLMEWQESMLTQQYAIRTINSRIAVANSFLEYLERWEFRLQKPLEILEDIQPELTRTEYLRLLSTAKQLERERVYFLVKVFGTIGLSLHDLPLLTVEALQEGRLILPAEIVYIPDCLCEELMDYAKRNGIASGPIFITRSGRLMNRSNITMDIRRLCEEARVEPSKGSPRCLRKLYQSTQENIRANLSLLLEQAYDRLLETEQVSVGWENGIGRK